MVLIQAVSPQTNLEHLRADPELTPERFARQFQSFRFELNDEIQSPETFLSRGLGDCDDYATLAATVLGEKGYHPKLVVVFMQKQIHAVCFIRETGVYLDFNNRRGPVFTIASNGTLEDIAKKVAAGFRDQWFAVGEFTLQGGERTITHLDFPQAEDRLAVKE